METNKFNWEKEYFMLRGEMESHIRREMRVCDERRESAKDTAHYKVVSDFEDAYKSGLRFCLGKLNELTDEI